MNDTATTQQGIGLNDLRAMLNLIQVVSSRGAIKAGEMSTVGDLHDRLAAFLASVDKAAQAAQQQADEANKGE